MEIQQGKGPWASPVNGIVPLGTTLTMVVGIDDKEGKRNMQTYIKNGQKWPKINKFRLVYHSEVQVSEHILNIGLDLQ